MLILVLLLYLVHKAVKNSKIISKVKKAVFAALFFNAFIRAFIQSYLPLVLNAYSVLIEVANTNSIFEGINQAFAFLFGGFLTIYPIMIAVFLWKLQDYLDESKYKDRFGTMYSGLELDNGFKPLLYNVIFVSRRLVLVWIIIFVSSLPFFQI